MNKIECCYRIEQLVYLGMPSQIFIPAVLQELHHNIPALSNTFCWIDAKGNLCNIFDEKLDTHVIDEFISSLIHTADENRVNTINWVSQIKSVITSKDMFGKDSHLAEFYKKVLIPMGYYNTCFVPIQHQGKNIGILMVHRHKDDAPFNQTERQQLPNIASMIAEGMTQKPRKLILHMDGLDQGLLTVDQSGKLLQGCNMGMKLLMLAHSDTIDDKLHSYPPVSTVFRELPALIKALTAINVYSSKFSNTVLTTSNAWGNFNLRCFLVNDYANRKNKPVGLIISKQEPFILRLFHRIKIFGLTPRQETVGLLYASGFQHQQIADVLKLSLYTVKEHVHNLCEHLEIQSRSELIELIICDLNPEFTATI